MKLHQCQTNQPNNDMIFGHRIGTKKIVAEKQQKVIKHIRQLPRSKEDNYFQEAIKANEQYDLFLEKMNTFKIQQALILTKQRFQDDNKFANLLEYVPEEKENDKKIKKELESYIDRYVTMKKGPAPRHPQFYYFI
ncbi:unnamed protein product (macronuclear) [Paramecium tetraurelia]|uniref:Uncharacterized protein n=1 Tax=Paramecium tetraurelia TaxID=5888 RepID=A0CVI0_PARTE|nr:uncharacterized protein GSPATT00010965001 [Paramecium tetraurelia]CAK74797.1 unnamed protein product [Paramecium tetraurelia]|eukprot:XP_001442194.1 hypothetical protein (macronuclear) [Paramecium tetraurelia strain d4-2]